MRKGCEDFGILQPLALSGLSGEIKSIMKFSLSSMRTTLLFFLSSFTLDAQIQNAVTIDSASSRKIDSLFQDWNKKDTPGGVVAIIANHRVIYKKAFGMADLRKRVPNSVESAFDLASIAKQFTGMCIALLEEQGKLSVEDDIHKYYPEFQFGKPIPIKHLLDHTSGIREAYVLATLSGKVNLKGALPKKYNTKKFLFEVLKHERDLNFNPGDEMAYTNVNYIILGDIVEKVSGMSLRKFADSAIFKPLGMLHTVFRDHPEINEPTEATGYLFNGKKFKKRKPQAGVVGDGNLLSTLDDLVRWDQNFYENKLGNRDPELIKRITTTSLLKNGDTTYYGYGLFILKERGLLKVGHGGDNGMHTSIITRFPNEQFTVICLANSSRYYSTESKANYIGELILRDRFTKPTKPDNIDSSTHVSEADMKKKIGLYTNIDEKGLGHLRKVMYKDGSLYIAGYYYGDGMKLSAIKPDYFVFKNNFGTLHVQFKDTVGTIKLVEQWRDGPPVTLVPEKKDLKIHYDDFKGSYHNSSTGATLKVKSKKGKIVARKGIIRIPLIPFDRDIFYATQNDALLIFRRGADGEVSEMKINARDFRNFKLIKR